MIYLVIILALLVLDAALTFIVDILNVRHISPALPEEFKDVLDPEKYAKSQRYLKENTAFGLTVSAIFALLQIAFILAGGFNYADQLARSFALGETLTGVIYAGILMFALQLLKVPFSAYRTFRIEEKFGFNRTTVKTFITDILKGWLLGALIGAPVFGLILWFFESAGSAAWRNSAGKPAS